MPGRSRSTEVTVGGRRLTLSNLDKLLYPDSGFTKGQVIDYYVRAAPVLLPHLRGRPLTLKRYPEGTRGFFFYEKQCPRHRPGWLHTVPVWSEKNAREVIYCVVDDLASLVWIANLADLELHTSLSVAPDVERPTVLAFDLDPGPPATIVECAQVALWVRDLLGRLGLSCFAKTSGSKGLQVYVPLNLPVGYDATKSFARSVARLLERDHPGEVVSLMRKDLRPGKVFIDWSQNDRHKTTVCVYSLRARERPMASTPVTWAEVERLWWRKRREELDFTSDQVLERIARHGDLFAAVLAQRQHLPGLGEPGLPLRP